MLGAIAARIGFDAAIINGISEMFGGGCARAPRMNAEQKEVLRSQANLNNAMAGRLAGGCDRARDAQNGLCGQPCPSHSVGPISHCGMHGARNCGHGGGAGPVHTCVESLHQHGGEACGAGREVRLGRPGWISCASLLRHGMCSERSTRTPSDSSPKANAARIAATAPRGRRASAMPPATKTTKQAAV